jgi:hypothetical protein
LNRSPYGQRLEDGRRQCAKCRKWLQPEAFRSNPRLQDGLGSWCKSCQLASTREWRAENRAAILAQRRKHWAAHRDEINAARRAQYAARKAA